MDDWVSPLSVQGLQMHAGLSVCGRVCVLLCVCVCVCVCVLCCVGVLSLCVCVCVCVCFVSYATQYTQYFMAHYIAVSRFLELGFLSALQHTNTGNCVSSE